MGLLRPITMQDVRLHTGESELTPADVLAGCNAELAAREARHQVGLRRAEPPPTARIHAKTSNHIGKKARLRKAVNSLLLDNAWLKQCVAIDVEPIIRQSLSEVDSLSP